MEARRQRDVTFEPDTNYSCVMNPTPRHLLHSEAVFFTFSGGEIVDTRVGPLVVEKEPSTAREPITQSKIDRVFGLNDKEERKHSLKRHAEALRQKLSRHRLVGDPESKQYGRPDNEVDDFIKSLGIQ